MADYAKRVRALRALAADASNYPAEREEAKKKADHLIAKHKLTEPEINRMRPGPGFPSAPRPWGPVINDDLIRQFQDAVREQAMNGSFIMGGQRVNTNSRIFINGVEQPQGFGGPGVHWIIYNQSQ